MPVGTVNFSGWIFGSVLLIGVFGCQPATPVAGAAPMDHSTAAIENAPSVSNFIARPLRLSTAVLQRPLVAVLVVRDPSGRTESRTGDARWTLTDLPGSTGESKPVVDAGEATDRQDSVQARFIDRLGCLEFAQAPAARICFQVMGDVASVGLNPRELKSARFGDLWPAGAGSDAEIAFRSARRDGSDYLLRFESSGQRIDVRLQVL